MLTTFLFVMLIGLLGWHWALVGLAALVYFQLYPIRTTIIFILLIGLFILGKKIRKNLTNHFKRYLE